MTVSSVEHAKQRYSQEMAEFTLRKWEHARRKQQQNNKQDGEHAAASSDSDDEKRDRSSTKKGSLLSWFARSTPRTN